MRITTREAALVTLPTLMQAANGVTLSDWTPKANNLPEGCDKVYKAPIPGCGPDDFTTNHCSQSCIYALESLVTPIKDACGNRGVGGQNLVVAFLADVGPAQICFNAPKTWTGGVPSKTAGASSSSSTVKTTRKITSIKTSGVLTASTSVKTSSLVVDTSRTPATGPLASQTASGTSKVPGQLNTNDHSGGGSPFDTLGNMGGAASLSISAALSIVSVALLLFTGFR